METALEVFSPELQKALPKEDVVVTIVPEIYTFWRQNRPGTVACPVDAAVHQESGSLFFSDHRGHQIVMSDLHCPATLTPIVGERQPGYRDGEKSLFFGTIRPVFIQQSSLCV